MIVLALSLIIAMLGWVPQVAAQAGKPMSIAELAAYNKPDREKVLYEGAKKGRLMGTPATGDPTATRQSPRGQVPGIKLGLSRRQRRDHPTVCRAARALCRHD
jgi:hypothetical protein